MARDLTGPLRVRVVSGGAPVEGVEVVLESGIGCTTDADGIARFRSAKSTDTLRIREVGYFPFEEGVSEADEALGRAGSRARRAVSLTPWILAPAWHDRCLPPPSAPARQGR